nr:MAG TPA: hypothetical protein [Caudoviricetes sp.]
MEVIGIIKVIDCFYIYLCKKEKSMDRALSWSAISALITFAIQQVVKTVLDIIKSRSEIVFSKLHQERAEVVKQLFQKLTILQQTLIDLTSMAQIADKSESKEDIQKRLNKQFNQAYIEALNLFSLNRIFLSHNLCDKINGLLSEIRVAALDYEDSCSTIEGGIKCNSKELIANGTKEKRQIRELVRNELSDLLNELEAEFRKLLGVKNKK